MRETAQLGRSCDCGDLCAAATEFYGTDNVRFMLGSEQIRLSWSRTFLGAPRLALLMRDGDKSISRDSNKSARANGWYYRTLAVGNAGRIMRNVSLTMPTVMASPSRSATGPCIG